MRDPYRLLGVSPDATEDEIRRAYRAAARREHPDVSQRADAAERMAELNEAYAAVGDPEARAETTPPAGWAPAPDAPPPATPKPARRRRRWLRRTARLLLGILLLAVLLGTLALAVVYVRDQPLRAGLAAGTTAAAVAPADETIAPAPSAFAADAEGCMLWRQYELQAARAADVVREAVLVARAEPASDEARRVRVIDLTEALTPAVRQLRDARDVVALQERDSGLGVPWRGTSEALRRAAVGLRAYYRKYPAGDMPRDAPRPVVAAMQAVESYDDLVRDLGTACS